MNIKHTITYTFIVLLLIGCATPDKPDTEVDRISLLRSMTYTHRNLVEMELEPRPVEDINRKSLLLKSHCDLIDRRLVLAEEMPTVCQKPDDPKALVCISRFHRCIGQCPTFKQSCQRCEKTLQRCIIKK